MWQIEQSLKVKLVWAALLWGDDKKMPAHEKRAPPARVNARVPHVLSKHAE